MTKNSHHKKIAVAMSGGVDSSVAAALLLQQGHDVFGVTMMHFDASGNPAQKAAKDAAGVCKKLGIPHFVFDIKNQFQKHVINNFVDEYLAGRTPNPCVQCNKTIKWGALLELAKSQGADFIATGHYLNLQFNKDLNRYQLLKSSNKQKDQSYALWRLSQEQLSHTLFPLENLEKDKVREIAASLQLDIAQKAESQDICFIPENDLYNYLTETFKTKNIAIEKGNIVNQEGETIGQHKGFPFYTIGQRKGLGIALGHPVYVTKIDSKNNEVRIGLKKDLLSDGLIAKNTNWVSIEKPEPDMPVEARIRYRDPGYPAVIKEFTDNSVKIHFVEPRPAVTPGQSLVLYQDELLIGGGIIDSRF